MLLRRPGLELLELHEQAAQVLRPDARPGVLHLEAEELLAFGRGADSHQPALRGELERVGEVVVEHLLQSGRIHHHAPDGRIDRHLDADVLLGGGGPQDRGQLVHQLAQIDGLGPEVQLS